MPESSTDYYRLLSDAFGPHVPGTREARKLVYDQLRKALKEQVKIASHRLILADEQKALEKAIVDVEISAKLGEPIPRFRPGSAEEKKPEPVPDLPPRPAVVEGHAVILPVQPFKPVPFSYRPATVAAETPVPVEPVSAPPPVHAADEISTAGPHIEFVEPQTAPSPAVPALPPKQFIPSQQPQPAAGPRMPQVYPPFPPELMPQAARPVRQTIQPKFQQFLNRGDRVSYARRADPKPQPKEAPPPQQEPRAPMPQAVTLPPPEQKKSTPLPDERPPSKPQDARKKPAPAAREESGDVHVLEPKPKKSGKVFTPAHGGEAPPRRRGGAIARVLLLVVLAAAIGGVVTYILKPEQLLERFLAERQSSAPQKPAAAAPSPTGASVAIGEAPKASAQDLVNLAISQSSQREYSRALATLDQAQKLGAGDATFYQARAFAFWGAGNTERAIADYGDAIRLDPGNSSNFTNRAVAYNSRGEYMLAIRDLERAIAIDPGNPDNWNSRCWARALAGLMQEAILDCNESLRLRPNDPNTLDSRGFAHLKAGQNSRAIADFDAALKLEPNIASSIYGRGVARLRSGDRTRGNADIDSAKAMNPNIEALFVKYGVR